MTTSAERVAMCDKCIYGKNVHWFGDFHEYCDAEHCVICFQTGKLGDECEDFTPET